MDKFWIGLNDLTKRDGSYSWADYSRNDYFRWAPNEPIAERYGSRRCVEMTKPVDNFGSWYTNDCGLRQAFVCASNKQARFPIFRDYDNCEGDYSKYDGECYRFFHERRSWDGAEQKCSEEGGHLATASDFFTLAFLTTISKNDSWIGLKLRPYGKQRWATGDFSIGPNVASILIKHYSGCLAFDKSKAIPWHVLPCNDIRPFICQAGRGSTTIAMTTPAEKKICSDKSLYLYNNHCYYVSPNTATFNGSIDMCSKRNMSIVSIHTSMENEAIAKMVKETTAALKVKTKLFYIGLFHDSKSNDMNWVDQSSRNFMSLSPSFEAMKRMLKVVDKFCFVFNSESEHPHKWFAAPCIHMQYGYICKMKADVSQTTSTTATTTPTTTQITTSTTATPSTTTTTPTATTTRSFISGKTTKTMISKYSSTSTATSTAAGTTTKLNRSHYKGRQGETIQNDDEVSQNHVAAIVVGSLAFVLLILVVVLVLRSGYIKKYMYPVQESPESGFHNALYSKSGDNNDESVNFD